MGFVEELTTDHVEPIDGGLVVDAPTGTEEVRVERAFLRDRLGAWGADHAFTLSSGRVVAAAETVTFTSFEPNGTPTYTLGARDAIRLTERPMWLSVDQDDDRSSITVTADAADTSGQPVRVDAEWLWDRGLIAPQAVHEDGSKIPVAWVEGGGAYRVDVPHFSAFELCNSFFTTDSGSDCGSYEDVSAELDVKVRVDGVVADHDGQELWDSKNRTLHVEVDDYLTTVEVLVERAWVDDHIDHLAVWNRTVTNETVDGAEYYVSSFSADQTPTDHVVREYQASNKTMFTAGNLSIIGSPVWGFINVSSRDGELSLEVRPPAGSNVSRYPLLVNDTFLSDRSVTSPVPFNESGERIEVGGTPNETFFLVDASATNPASVSISNGSLAAGSQDGECDAAMTRLPMGSNPPTWWHDDNNSYSYASVYVGEGIFCWDWHLNTEEIEWNNLSHYQVWGYAKDPSTGEILCEIWVPAGDPVKMRDAYKECEPEGSIPTSVVVYFGAHAMRKEDDGGSESDSQNSYYVRRNTLLMKASDWQNENCQVIPTAVAFHPGVAAGQVAAHAFCVSPAAPWLWEQATNLWTDWVESEEEDEEGNPELKVWHERLITNTSMEVDVPEADIHVNVVDTNSKREDTWDFLEEAEDGIFGDSSLLDYPSGPQSIVWEVKDVEEGDLQYDSNLSHIDEISQDTDDNDNYRTTDWNPGQTYLEARAWDEVTDFTSPTLKLETVDWEAPEPLPKEAKIEDCGDTMAASETVSILATDPEANRTEAWMDVEVIDFSGLDPENVSDFGNISLQEIDLWNSTAKAIANATVDNETFVTEACGVDETISYDYESPMSASSSGSSTIRDVEVHASDEEVYTIRWYYIPPP